MASGPHREAGERVGPFEIERYLASGGMGDVYVGRSLASGERVALKFLAHASPANLERFEREGRIAAALSHPHIVSGRGFGRTDDGVAWLAMELLEGSDLDERLRSRGLSPLESVAVAMQICEALEHAHARRIVHRDLKPQNVWVCAPPAGEGREGGLHVKVLDFGIARLADERRMTGTGVIVGSWSYMSPEQARAEPDLDARSDLWSLGVLLYECLAGRLPFDAPTGPGTLYQILFEKPPELAGLCPWLPRELAALVHRALSRPRDERPASAAALRAALAVLDRAALLSRDAAPQARGRRGQSAEPPSVEHTVLAGGDELAGATLEHSTGGGDAGVTVENRLTCVVFLRGVREPRLVADVARELQARLAPLPNDDSLAVFGSERWTGDEPLRAVRLATAVAGALRSAGVATGHAVRGTVGVAGAAVDTAVALSRGEGVRVDATTAAIVRGKFPLEARPDGSFALAQRGPRTGASMPDDAASGAPQVGRDAELGVLCNAAEAAQSELAAQGVVVLGAAGMGKSRLRIEATLEALRREPEATPVTVRCEAFRRDTPFGALTDALRELVDASVLAALRQAAEDPADPRAALDRARSALEVALRALAARGPVLLAVDDVQWLDGPSQSALRWVFENAVDLPLALWLFGRPDGRAAALAVLPAASVLELKPLAKAAAEKLLQSIAGAAPEALLERAAGNPLFLEELGRLFAQTGDANVLALPPSVEGASLAQLDALEPMEREYLKRASVLGRTAWHEAVLALGGEGSALEALRRANLLVPRPRSRFEGAREVAFRNGVLHEVCYALWTDEQRARLHERAAEWLGAQAGVAPEELARHWDLAGDAPRAAAAYTEAAERSVRVSTDTAATLALAERALVLVRDAAVRFRALAVRDSALRTAGDWAKQAEGLVAMELLADELGLAQRTEAAWRRCSFARLTSDHEGALAAGRRALALAGELDDPRWVSTIHNDLALMLANDGHLAQALEEAERGQSFAAATGDEWHLARAAMTRAYVLAEMGRLAVAHDAFEAAARRFSAAGDQGRALQAEANAAIVALDLGREAEAAQRFARLLAPGRNATVPALVIARQNRATLHRVRGEFEACREDLAAVEAQAERMRHRRLLAAVAVEALYLELAAPAPSAPDALEGLLASKLSIVDAARTPALHLSARAAALRLAVARGGASDEHGRELDRLLASAELKPLGEIEALVALAALRGADTAALARAVGRLRSELDAPADEPSLLRWLSRRLLVAERVLLEP